MDSASAKDLRIVLLGKTGSGKSATGNTILKRDAFIAERSPSSVTKVCQKETVHLDDRTVTIIDTPGVFDTSIPEKELKREIENCIVLSLPGPHIFLLVISLSARFTMEEKNAINLITDNFGEKVSKHTIVVFTRGDQIKDDTIENYLHKSPELRKLTSDCKAGYVVFDNTCKGNRTQVADLLENIDKTVQLNGGHYTSEIYQQAQNKLWWHQARCHVGTAGNYLLCAAAGAAAAGLAAAGAAAPVATAAVAVVGEEAAALSIPQVLAVGSAAIVNGVGWFRQLMR